MDSRKYLGIGPRTRKSILKRKHTRKVEDGGDVFEDKEDRSLSEVQSAKPVRKSTRQRFAPLDHWRNERLLYRYENGSLNLKGIDKGFNEDDASVQFLLKSQRKKVFPKPKEAKWVTDDGKYTFKGNLLQRFSLVHWDIEKDIPGNKSGILKKMFQTSKAAFGFIQISVGDERKCKYGGSGSEDVLLTVFRGEIEISFRNNCIKATEKDMFFAPHICNYTIKNVGKICALLSYAIGNFL